MKTYIPIHGMILCARDTGYYVEKTDYDALKAELKEARRIVTEQSNLRLIAEDGLNHVTALKNKIHERYQSDLASKEAELAAERARLDWMEKRGPWESWLQPVKENSLLLRAPIRAAIDVAMKEGAK